MCRVLVASDDDARTRRLERAFSAHPDAALLQVDTCALPEAASRLTAATADADAVDVDVLFIDVSSATDPYAGIKVASALQSDRPHASEESSPQVVYLSSRETYTSMVYQTRHCYLLLDPFSSTEVRDALNKALACRVSRAQTPLALKCMGSVHVVFPKDIVFVKSVGRKVMVSCVDGQQHEAYAALADVEQHLPKTFVRCHKSYLANIEFVSSIGNGALTMRDGQVVPVSQRRTRSVREAMLNCGHAS